MFGGGGVGRTIEEAYDDHKTPGHIAASYLGGALPSHFGYDNWGAEQMVFQRPTLRELTQDESGRIPPSATNRNSNTGGEWMASAYDGEGMCFAWLCGRALSQMILGNDTETVADWFPKPFLVTEKRLDESPRSMRKGQLPSRVG